MARVRSQGANGMQNAARNFARLRNNAVRNPAPWQPRDGWQGGGSAALGSSDDLILAAPAIRIVLMDHNTSTLPPPVAMLQLITGYWVSRAVFVFAKLGIADRLAAGPRTAADLAGDVRVDPRCLHRLLRMLAGSGVLASDRDGRFRLTTLGETLRSDVPDSMHGFAVMMVEDYNWDGWKGLGWSVETGQTAFEKVFREAHLRVPRRAARAPEGLR